MKNSHEKVPSVDDLQMPSSCGLGSRIAALAVFCDRVADYAENLPENLTASPPPPPGRKPEIEQRPLLSPHRVGLAATPARNSSTAPSSPTMTDLHRECDELAGKAEQSASSAAKAITTTIGRTTNGQSQGTLLEDSARAASAATGEALAEAEVLASTSRRFCEAANEELCCMEANAQRREQQLLMELSEARAASEVLAKDMHHPVSDVQQLIIDLKAEAAAAMQAALTAEDATHREFQARRKAERELQRVEQVVQSLHAQREIQNLTVLQNSAVAMNGQLRSNSKKNSYSRTTASSPRSDVTVSPPCSSVNTQRCSASQSPRRLWPNIYEVPDQRDSLSQTSNMVACQIGPSEDAPETLTEEFRGPVRPPVRQAAATTTFPQANLRTPGVQVLRYGGQTLTQVAYK